MIISFIYSASSLIKVNYCNIEDCILQPLKSEAWKSTTFLFAGAGSWEGDSCSWDHVDDGSEAVGAMEHLVPQTNDVSSHYCVPSLPLDQSMPRQRSNSHVSIWTWYILQFGQLFPKSDFFLIFILFAIYSFSATSFAFLVRYEFNINTLFIRTLICTVTWLILHAACGLTRHVLLWLLDSWAGWSILYHFSFCNSSLTHCHCECALHLDSCTPMLWVQACLTGD